VINYLIKCFWRLHYSVSNEPYSFERAWKYAIWLLGRQAYSKAQIIERLQRKQATAQIVEQVIKKLESCNYLDDATYAEMVVRGKQRSHGRIALKQTLRQKGVSEQVIDEALEGLSAEQEQKAACALLQKQAWRFKGGDPRKNYAKAYAYLARRGFNVDCVNHALEASQLFSSESL
jgi:regulatory protein